MAVTPYEVQDFQRPEANTSPSRNGVEEMEAPLLEVLTPILEAVEAINNCANTMKNIPLLEAVASESRIGRSRLI